MENVALEFKHKYSSPIKLTVGDFPDDPHFLLTGLVKSNGYILDRMIEIFLFKKEHVLINKTEKKVGDIYQFKIYEEGEYYIIYDNGCKLHLLDEIHIKI